MMSATHTPAQMIPTVDPAFAVRRQYRANSAHPQLWTLLDQVCDPELPGLTLWDLGVLQDVQLDQQGCTVVITPTYSGCPATEVMAADIVTVLTEAGFEPIIVKVTLSPAWGTDMLSPAAKKHLASLTIAPPQADDQPACPICASTNTTVLSQFGSTACKALHRCLDCSETFDYFKRI